MWLAEFRKAFNSASFFLVASACTLLVGCSTASQNGVEAQTGSSGPGASNLTPSTLRQIYKDQDCLEPDAGPMGISSGNGVAGIESTSQPVSNIDGESAHQRIYATNVFPGHENSSAALFCRREAATVLLILKRDEEWRVIDTLEYRASLKGLEILVGAHDSLKTEILKYGNYLGPMSEAAKHMAEGRSNIIDATSSSSGLQFLASEGRWYVMAWH